MSGRPGLLPSPGGRGLMPTPGGRGHDNSKKRGHFEQSGDPSKRQRMEGQNGGNRRQSYPPSGQQPRHGHNQQQPGGYGQKTQMSTPPPPGGAKNVYLTPVEGAQGLELGFNYWVSEQTRVMVADVRELVLRSLAGKPLPDFLRKNALPPVRRKVVLACVSGLSPPQAVQELQPARASSTDPPLCPFLRTCSSVPTRFTTIVSAANIRAEDTVSAPSSLLWCPQPPVSLEGLRHASLPRLFADHVLFIATDVGVRWDDRMVFKPLEASAEQDDATTAALARLRGEEDEDGEEEEEEEGEEGEVEASEEDKRPIAGTMTKLKGDRERGWWLLVGRELRMVWEGEEGVEPWRVGDWPPGPPTPQSPIPTLVLRGPVGNLALESAKLVVVEGIHVDHYSAPPDRHSHDADPSHANNPQGLRANKALQEAVKGLSGDYIRRFALTRQEQARMRYPLSASEVGQGAVTSGEMGGHKEQSTKGGGDEFGAREWLEDHYESSEDEAAQEPQDKDNTEASSMEVDGPVGGGRPVRLLGMDCEMVTTEHGLELARLSLVDVCGEVVLDRLVRPVADVVDHNTRYSGITPEMLQDVKTTLGDVQREVLELLRGFDGDTFLVGHALDGDLKALRLLHPLVMDTVALYPHAKGYPWKRSLKELAKTLLGRDIQQGHGTVGHDSIQDASVSLELAMIKMARGHGFFLPGAWSADAGVPRETIFRSLTRPFPHELPSPSSSPHPPTPRPVRCHVTGQRQGALLGTVPEDQVRLWSHFQRGYRPEADPIWVARAAASELNVDNNNTTENGTDPKERVCVTWEEGGDRDEVVTHALHALKTQQPDLLVMELPCTQHYDHTNSTAGVTTGAADKHFTSLQQIDAALQRVSEAAEPGTVIVVVVQGDLYSLYQYLELRQRARWDEPRRGVSAAEAQRSQVAGTSRLQLTEQLEKLLNESAANAMNGVTFLHLVPPREAQE